MFWENQPRSKDTSWKLRRDVTRCIVTWTIPTGYAASTRRWWKTWKRNWRESSFPAKTRFSSIRKKSQERWMATLVTERQLNELRKKNNHIGQILANVQFKYTPFPGEGDTLFLMLTMQPTEVQKYLGVAWPPRRRKIMLGGLKDWGSYARFNLSQHLGLTTHHHDKTYNWLCSHNSKTQSISPVFIVLLLLFIWCYNGPHLS